MSLKLNFYTPKKSLNAAFLKVRPLRSEIDTFKTNLIKLLDKVDESEREENQKNHIRDFLVNTYYNGKREVNTKGSIDLVIHTDSTNKSSVGVIIEAKRPSNKSEWISADKPNGKALQEAVLYYMRERVDAHNIDIKHIILTNIYEWYVIDAAVFDKHFYQNKKFVKAYESWRDGQKVTSDTALFYTEIAKPYLDEINDEVPCTFFDIRSYEKELHNADKEDDKTLIELYKLLSEHHLLHVPFANDSNSLDKRFYTELLHIIGLTETKEGSKKLIGRHKEGERHSGTILEDAIIQIEAVDKLHRVTNISQYGSTKDERLFNIALELSITWINRILFLKLLEGQLVGYHRGDKNYLFLNSKTIREYDDLNTIFFQVLAKKHEERNGDVKTTFARVPYLNSSLFEPTELEHEAILISNLRDEKTMPIHSQTVLKDANGQKRTGTISALEYLFAFLDAYDFASEGSGDIQEDNKTLINASVLGLIFEKINGYKDGSFFTPGFITMYMCRETIRRAVVQKFNESKGWTCHDLTDLYNKIEDRHEANAIVNSIKICDPAVGSGHFLVSALNEMIAIKSDLKILQDINGRILKGYKVEVVNDELSIRDEDGDLYAYNPRNTESQRIQETLFHEKQTIIESCLFGVDINPNSVKICRLRLWIELLKNAYYVSHDFNRGIEALETLPNIDINIKCGNSLVSRYKLDADLSIALKSIKYDIKTYRGFVQDYKNCKDKEEKNGLKDIIDRIKNNFQTKIGMNDPKKKKLDQLMSELYHRFTGNFLFEPEEPYGNKKDQAGLEKEKLEAQINKLSTELESIKNNVIFQNAFEWRFEFPEVLNDNGDFEGFDVVIGNPPYIRQEEFSDLKPYLKEKYKIYHSIADLLTYFVELSHNILKKDGVFQFIISNKFTRADYGKVMRMFLLDHTSLTHYYDFSGIPVFDEATVDAAILGYIKVSSENSSFSYLNVKKEELVNVNDFPAYVNTNKMLSDQSDLNEGGWSFQSSEVLKIKEHVESQGIPLKEWHITINYGIKTGLNEAFVIDKTTKDRLIAEDPNCAAIIKPMVRGRDIQKYDIIFEDLYLIGTFPAKSLNIDDYPAIRNYLESFGTSLYQTGEKGSRKKTSNKWFETQDNIAYWEDFEKPKIMYPVMTKFLNFAYDDSGFYGNDKVFTLLGEQLEWLTCFFNSKLWAYCFRDNFPELLGGTRELRKVFMEEIKVKKVDEETLAKCREFIAKIKGGQLDVMPQIDQLVYELYGLTEDEIGIVERK